MIILDLIRKDSLANEMYSQIKFKYICYFENILNITVGVQFSVLIKVDFSKKYRELRCCK